MQVHSPNDCAPIGSASPSKPPSEASSAIALTEEEHKKDIGEGSGGCVEPSHVKVENGCAAVRTFQMLQASVMENAQVRFTRRACSASLGADLIL